MCDGLWLLCIRCCRFDLFVTQSKFAKRGRSQPSGGQATSSEAGPPRRKHIELMKDRIGVPSRAPDLDVKPGFVSPPPGYGEVAFYWWVGDPLTRQRLTWQLDRLAGHHISGLQLNYAHSDQGGLSWGLSYPSEPPLFSEAWWELFGWFMAEAKKRGMSVSLSDYTLGVGQGSTFDNAVNAYPQIQGRVLRHERRQFLGGTAAQWDLPKTLLCLAQAADGRVIDLLPKVDHGELSHVPAEDSDVIAVWYEDCTPSIDPTHPDSGRAVIDHFFQPFERRFPGEGGAGLNFFFSDELEFKLRGKVWSERLEAEFLQRKGYDLRPHLAALFVDCGPITPKVRLDYNDVFVSLSEEHYFKPVYHWHESRGMIFGCDHGGRGRDVAEFGDYFRTQRWNQGPGCDQPRLGRDLIKNKVASSIAHLYERPRVWLEGFYSSGWGTSSGQVWDAIAVNFLQGHNLLTLHGLYYTTHGGWWEWAPPCNHFRMPYWSHMRHLLAASERLSYLLSQGTHVCDVAVLYPVADAVGGEGRATRTAFEVAEALHSAGRDFDFIDAQSLDRAEFRGGRMYVSGESYGVLVLPGTGVVHHSTLTRAAEFARKGGVVVMITPLPLATDRLGRDDPEVARGVADLRECGVVAENVREAVAAIVARTNPEVEIEGQGPATEFLHRRAGTREVYAFIPTTAGCTATFRTRGVPELWDPWTGTASAIPVVSQSSDATTLRLRNGLGELHVVVFSPGVPEIAAPLTRGAEKQAVTMPIDGNWACEFIPTMDNTWGDFHWPPTPGLIGPEAREFRYLPGEKVEGVPQRLGQAPVVRAGFGPKFLRLGPCREPLAQEEERRLSGGLSPQQRGWSEYVFSWQRGVADDPGHQGYHGLKEEMNLDFIRLGNFRDGHPSTRRESDPLGDLNYLWTTVRAEAESDAVLSMGGGLRPRRIWLNGGEVVPGPVRLKVGANVLLLRYDGYGAGWAVVHKVDTALPSQSTSVGSLRSPWADGVGLFPFNIRPREPSPVGWYEMEVPPGTRAFTLEHIGEVRAWCGGELLRSAPAGAGRGDATRFELAQPLMEGGGIVLQVHHVRGFYGGDSIPAPVRFECEPGLLPAGDWSNLPGLRFYSGGIRYRRTIDVSAELLKKSSRVQVDLGDVVSSAEVHVNGKPAGVRLAPPWRFDVTSCLRPGGNDIEVIVYSALAGHYRSVPTRYLGTEQRSGLIGPVTLAFDS